MRGSYTPGKRTIILTWLMGNNGIIVTSFKYTGLAAPAIGTNVIIFLYSITFLSQFASILVILDEFCFGYSKILLFFYLSPIQKQ